MEDRRWKMKRFSAEDEEDTCQLQLFDGRPDAGKPMVKVQKGTSARQ